VDRSWAKCCHAAWIEDALWAPGTASIRLRRLPAEQAIWLVLGMALLRRESIERQVAQRVGWTEAALEDVSATRGVHRPRRCPIRQDLHSRGFCRFRYVGRVCVRTDRKYLELL